MDSAIVEDARAKRVGPETSVINYLVILDAVYTDSARMARVFVLQDGTVATVP